MVLSAEAVLAIVGLFIALPPAIIVMRRFNFGCFRSRSQLSSSPKQLQLKIGVLNIIEAGTQAMSSEASLWSPRQFRFGVLTVTAREARIGILMEEGLLQMFLIEQFSITHTRAWSE